ncbi:MAG: hypothetical protein U1E14_09395 [Geminicoccaceae bacterium]
MLRQALVAVLLIVAAAAAVFQLSYAVVGLERQLTQLRRELDNERWLVRTRKADLAYLTRPERLAQQAEQLGLHPARAAQIVDVDRIGNRAEVMLSGIGIPVTLPSGTAAELRLRPMPVFADVAAEHR